MYQFLQAKLEQTFINCQFIINNQMNFLKRLIYKNNKAPIHNVKNPLFKLFLQGLKGIFEIKRNKPYNYYIFILSTCTTIFFSQYLIKFTKNEFEQREQPNLLIPKYIYQIRSQHFNYWELSRLARGKSTTFSYYHWDDQNNLMYMIDRAGKQTPLQVHSTIQTPDNLVLPLLEKYYPATPKLQSKIYMYTKNIDNPYDLDNHLHHKSVNIGDWLRAAYYFIYRELGITNRWRYDEYISKPDIYYDWQKVKLGYRIFKDREILYRYLDKLDLDKNKILKFFIWFI